MRLNDDNAAERCSTLVQLLSASGSGSWQVQQLLGSLAAHIGAVHLPTVALASPSTCMPTCTSASSHCVARAFQQQCTTAAACSHNGWAAPWLQVVSDAAVLKRQAKEIEELKKQLADSGCVSN